MKIVFKTNKTNKTNTAVEIRQLSQRSGKRLSHKLNSGTCIQSKTTKSLRPALSLQRSKLPKQTLIPEASFLAKETLLKRVTPTIVTYPVPGQNTVNQISYVEPDQNTNKGLVWINQAQYFENVPPNVWNFCVGNYCVCQKWLAMREGSTLDHQSIQDYQRLVMLISETIDLMNNVDSQLVSN
jgi:hypothetical protein